MNLLLSLEAMTDIRMVHLFQLLQRRQLLIHLIGFVGEQFVTVGKPYFWIIHRGQFHLFLFRWKKASTPFLGFELRLGKDWNSITYSTTALLILWALLSCSSLNFPPSSFRSIQLIPSGSWSNFHQLPCHQLIDKFLFYLFPLQR